MFSEKITVASSLYGNFCRIIRWVCPRLCLKYCLCTGIQVKVSSGWSNSIMLATHSWFLSNINLSANNTCFSVKAMARYSSTLAWKIPWMEEPGRLQFMGSLNVGHDWATSLTCIGEGNGNPLQCSCLENPRDESLVGCHLWGRTESDTTEVT